MKNNSFNIEQTKVIEQSDYSLNDQNKYQYVYELPKSGKELFGNGFGEATLIIVTN